MKPIHKLIALVLVLVGIAAVLVWRSVSNITPAEPARTFGGTGIVVSHVQQLMLTPVTRAGVLAPDAGVVMFVDLSNGSVLSVKDPAGTTWTQTIVDAGIAPPVDAADASDAADGD